MMTSPKADIYRKRQPISNEVEENLTLFFRRFSNTPEEMDAHLGFKGSH
jgi:hypothetical protein